MARADKWNASGGRVVGRMGVWSGSSTPHQLSGKVPTIACFERVPQKSRRGGILVPPGEGVSGRTISLRLLFGVELILWRVQMLSGGESNPQK